MIHPTEKTMPTTKLLGAAALAFGLALGLPAAQAQQGVSKNEIVLGTIQDLSGPLAGYGKQVRNGMLLRVGEIEAFSPWSTSSISGSDCSSTASRQSCKLGFAAPNSWATPMRRNKNFFIVRTFSQLQPALASGLTACYPPQGVPEPCAIDFEAHDPTTCDNTRSPGASVAPDDSTLAGGRLCEPASFS